MTVLSKKPADLAIEARWIIPVRPERTYLENQTVLIDQDRIVAIGSMDQLENEFEIQKKIYLKDHALIPGLINTHSHVGMTLFRGIADDVPLMKWLNDYIWPAEKALISERFVQDSSLLGCAEMLAGGVTTFNDMYFFPDGAADAVKIAGIRAYLGMVVLEFATPYARDAEDYIQKGLTLRDRFRADALIRFNFAPHAPYTVSDQTFEKIMTYAEQLNLGIHTHLHETADELDVSLSQYGARPIHRLAHLGVLGPNLLAAHCVHMNDQDIQALAYHGVSVAHCVSSNLKLASGIAPIRQMMAAGINVALGTDSAASNNRQDIFSELRMAALLSQGVTGIAGSIDAWQAIEMATLHGAKAIGAEHEIGSIEPGKFADLVAIRLNDLEVMPYFDPVSHVVYTLGREQVSHVWVGGDLRFTRSDIQSGVFANIEPSELREIVLKWQPKLNPYKR
jgi:5-methylthioadenosine/S-adenosylhomocysteine deaminase